MNAREEIIALRKKLKGYGHAYYDLDAPNVEDYEYDRLVVRLRELEKAYPELVTPDSPTQTVGGKPSAAFSPVTHEVPLESLNDVFSFEEITAFGARVGDAAAHEGYVVEPKIDDKYISLNYIRSFQKRPRKHVNALLYNIV